MSWWSPEISVKVYGQAAIALIILVLVISTIVRLFTYLTLGVCKSTKKMNGKTVIVTGANSGK